MTINLTAKQIEAILDAAEIAVNDAGNATIRGFPLAELDPEKSRPDLWKALEEDEKFLAYSRKKYPSSSIGE